MYETRIDLGRQVRLSLARLLNQRLADMIDFFNQTKPAHWYVKGPEFMQLHELLLEKQLPLPDERAFLVILLEQITRQLCSD
jgi:DNA-binding ferritin-like protein